MNSDPGRPGLANSAVDALPSKTVNLQERPAADPEEVSDVFSHVRLHTVAQPLEAIDAFSGTGIPVLAAQLDAKEDHVSWFAAALHATQP